ncbi:alpha/beta hydrolase [Myxococcota bacterium]|nr:alpha/beta hydrolase [Myxococcota bacterium]
MIAHDERVRHGRFTTNGVSLHAVLEGPDDGPLVILLHGFPELWYGWRKQLPRLGALGYLAVAPDQRGYGDSDKPRGLSAYVLDELAKDVVGLVDALGRERAFVVGHDWGAAVAWYTAMRYPARVERMVAINVPHPLVMRRFLRTSPRQLAMSWYMLFFQLPALPERVFTRNDGDAIATHMRRIARPGTFSDEELRVYRDAWRKPGAPRAMLDWYRAVRLQLSMHVSADEALIRPPTLLVWGRDDALLSEAMAAPSVALCEQGTLALVDGATHWVHHEEPERVTALIDAHLRGRSGAR